MQKQLFSFQPYFIPLRKFGDACKYAALFQTFVRLFCYKINRDAVSESFSNKKS